MFVYIVDIIESIDAIEEYIIGLNYEKFEENLGNYFKRSANNKETNYKNYSCCLINTKKVIDSITNPKNSQSSYLYT